MKRTEAISLENEAKKYINNSVKILEKDARNSVIENEYILIDVHGYSFETNIRTPGEISDPEDMFYHMKAILEEKKGRSRIEILPLEDVLEAIKNNVPINYNKWF